MVLTVPPRLRLELCLSDVDLNEALLGGVRLSLIPLIRSTVIPYP